MLRAADLKHSSFKLKTRFFIMRYLANLAMTPCLRAGRGMVFVLGRAGAIGASKASCRERGYEVRAGSLWTNTTASSR